MLGEFLAGSAGAQTKPPAKGVFPVCAVAAETDFRDTGKDVFPLPEVPCAWSQRPKLITDEWQKVLDLQAKGEVLSGTIKAVNRGGVVVEVSEREASEVGHSMA